MLFFLVPDPNKKTGQSEVSRIVCSIVQSGSTLYLNTNIPKYLGIAVMSRLKYKSRVVYITPSRTRLGAMRDFLFCKILSPDYIIAHFHGIGFSDSLVFKRNMASFDVIICLNDFMKGLMLSRFEINSELIVIENPCMMQFIDRQVVSCKSVVYFSNLMQEKGFGVFERLAENFKNVYTFSAAGRNLLNRSVSPVLNYLGCVGGDKKNKFLSESDIMIFYSSYREESYPLVLIEALYTGVLPVVKRHNGLHNIFHEYGFVWVDEEEEIIEFLSNKERVNATIQQYLMLRSVLRDNIIERFSKRKFQKKILDVLQTAM